MNDTRIARGKTRADWISRRGGLTENNQLWESAFDDFFKARLDSRYFEPIEKMGSSQVDTSCDQFEGEGFAIVAILCSLIEFLETCRTGAIFSTNGPQEYPPNPAANFQYGKNQSKTIFTTFLKTHLNFDEEQATCFYLKVRCAVLHNAQTDDPWVIRVAPTGVTDLVINDDGKTVLFRNIFLQKLKDYVVSYRTSLLSDPPLQAALIRKLDSL